MATSGGTCASAGHTNGCCVLQDGDQAENSCSVDIPAGGECHCDLSCHIYGDCCSDIESIQCFAREWLYIESIVLITIIFIDL